MNSIITDSIFEPVFFDAFLTELLVLPFEKKKNRSFTFGYCPNLIKQVDDGLASCEIKLKNNRLVWLDTIILQADSCLWIVTIDLILRNLITAIAIVCNWWSSFFYFLAFFLSFFSKNTLWKLKNQLTWKVNFISAKTKVDRKLELLSNLIIGD